MKLKYSYLTVAVGLVLFITQSCNQTQPKEKSPYEPTTQESKTERLYEQIYDALLIEDVKGAIRSCDELIALDSNIAKAYYLRGDANMYENNYKEAIPDFDKAVALDPTYTQAFYLRGYANLGLGIYEQALADFNETIDLDPNHIRALIDRGTCYVLMGEEEKGCNELAQAAEIAVKIDKIRVNKALEKYCQ